MHIRRIFVVACFMVSASVGQNISTNRRMLQWKQNDPCCSLIYSDGVAREHLADNGYEIDVWAPKVRDKSTYSVLVGIQNWTKGPVDVNPVRMGGLTDESTVGLMDSLDGDALVAKENGSAHRGSVIGNFLSGFAAGYSANQTAHVDYSDGTSGTVTVHDKSSVNEAEKEAIQRSKEIDNISAAESQLMLRRNTVAERGAVSGRVYIQRPKMSKKAHVGCFVVELGDKLYLFPFVNGAIPSR